MLGRLVIEDLRVEALQYPLGIHTEKPSLGWSYTASVDGAAMQKAYRVLVSTSEERLNQGIGDMWDSGVVESRRSVHVPYEGEELCSATRYYWRVQVWDEANQSAVSSIYWWEMGLLKEADWVAKWIGEPTDAQANTDDILPQFRHEFELTKAVKRARVYVCGLGHYELRLDGKKVGDSVLDPGWTNYDRTCLYSVYDVSDALSEGLHTVGIMLGNGHYNVTGGRYTKYRGSFGQLKCLVQIHVDYQDGTSNVVASNQDWQVHKSAIQFSCIYGGEDYDARKELSGWDKPNYEAAQNWRRAVEVSAPKGGLKAQLNLPLKVMKKFPPVDINEIKPGVYIIDFGQNFSGWVQIVVEGMRGSEVVIKPGELLEDGLVSQRHTGEPYQFTYILKGEGKEMWAPRFSYYGLRYVQIEGAIPQTFFNHEVSGEPCLCEIEGQMIYPDVPVRGWLETSNTLINRIHELINWAILSNMKSVFTDCPHREKLGWIEETHLMGQSIMYNYDVEAIFVKVIQDMKDAQLPNGLVPSTAPEYTVFDGEWNHFRDTVPWGMGYILLPWYVYLKYGNRSVLEEHYEGMKKYVDYVVGKSDHFIVNTGLGDWYDVGPAGPGYAQNTPIPLVETAALYEMVCRMQDISKVIERHQDTQVFRALGQEIYRAFQMTFYEQDTGVYGTDSQTSNAMPLVVGLVDQQNKQSVLQRLIDDVQGRGYHTTAGDIGHRYVLQALTSAGRSDVVYKMSCQTDDPSYGYQVIHGATTLTEAWDGPTVGKSQNHLMLGHLEEWLYSGLAGIDYIFDKDVETYRVSIQPAVVEGLEWVKAHYDLPVGRVFVSWRQQSEEIFSIEIQIPSNCYAKIYVPEHLLSKQFVIQFNQSENAGMNPILRDGTCVGYDVLPGTYQISIE